MSITVPGDRPDITTGGLSTGEIAVFDDWRAMIRSTHWQFAHAGTKIMGASFDSAWATTSTTYVQEPDSSVRSLDTYVGTGRLTREAANSDIYITYAAQMSDMDLRWTIDRVDDDGTTTQIDRFDLSNTTSTLQWVTTSKSYESDQFRQGGSGSNNFRTIEHTIEGRTDTDGDEANLQHFHAWGKLLASADLP